jgi:GH24 family phage-related lysozyme (muramidase)
MSTQASQITKARLLTEEGKKPKAYNDATGAVVTCQPHGNLSIGVGINLEVGLDNVEIEFLLQHRLDLTETVLLTHSWYAACDPVRASVYLDVAFNGGVEGFLHGYPECIKAAAAKDWTKSASELTVSDAHLDLVRYSPLRKILRTGTLT